MRCWMQSDSNFLKSFIQNWATSRAFIVCKSSRRKRAPDDRQMMPKYLYARVYLFNNEHGTADWLLAIPEIDVVNVEHGERVRIYAKKYVFCFRRNRKHQKYLAAMCLNLWPKCFAFQNCRSWNELTINWQCQTRNLFQPNYYPFGVDFWNG